MVTVHQAETNPPERRDLSLGGDGELRWYRCLKEGLEYAGYTLRKGDQINSSPPMCGKGVDLTKGSEVKDKKGKVLYTKSPCFELVKEMVEAGSEKQSPFEKKDSDPRGKKEIAEDIYLAVGEKISPAQLARIGRPDLLVMEQKYIHERDKDGTTAVIDEKVM